MTVLLRVLMESHLSHALTDSFHIHLSVYYFLRLFRQMPQLKLQHL